MVTLGQKLRLFRKDKKISQFELETGLGLGYGSISRIESDITVPTRTTLKKIAKFLELNDRQFDYLLGSRETLPDHKDIQKAIESTKLLWESKEHLVVLRDDHYRVCAVSEAMKMILRIDEKTWNTKIYLRNIISIMLDPSLPFYPMFDPQNNLDAKRDLRTMLAGFCYEMSYMRLEPDYADALEDIRKNKTALKIFEEMITNHSYPPYFLLNQRQLKANIAGNVVTLLFFTEVLPESTRFSYIYFFPKQ